MVGEGLGVEPAATDISHGGHKVKQLQIRYANFRVVRAFGGWNMMTTTDSLSLHQDLAAMIANSLPQEDLRNLRLVNKEWSALASSSVTTIVPNGPFSETLHSRFPFVEDISLHKQCVNNAEQLQHLQRYKKLRHLSLANQRKLRDQAIAFISQAHGLTSINLRGCTRLTWAAVGNLCELPNIRELNCAGIKYSAEHASSLTLPQLVSKLNALVIGDTCTLSFVDDSLLNLISMHGKNLTSLDCSGCIDVTDSGIASLTTLTNLEQLSVQSCVRLSNSTAYSIGSSLTNLQSLNLRGCLQLTDEGIAALAPLTRLNYLSVQGCTSVYGACFKALGGCSQLSTLNASGCTNLLYLQHLSKLQGLRSLNLSRCEKLQLGSLGWIGQLTGLTSLEATGLRNLAPLTPPEDSVNQSLEGWLSLLSKMQRLDLTGFTHPQGIPEGITNAISKMTALTELKMGDCVAPAWGPKETSSSATSDLSFLSPLVGLKHLDLSGWRHTNPEHLTALSSLDALQHLNISRFGNAWQHASATSSTASVESLSCSALYASSYSSVTSQANSDIDERACRAWQYARRAAVFASVAGAMEARSAQGSLCPSSSASVSDVSDMDSDIDMEFSVGSLDAHLANVRLASGSTSSSRPSFSMEVSSAPMEPACSALDRGLLGISCLTNLQTIVLQGCSKLTDAGVCSLASLNSLRSIDMGGCHQVTGEWLADLCGACTHLSSVVLEDCVGLQDACTSQAVASMKSVVNLDLGGCNQLSDETCEALAAARLPNLATLSLRGCNAMSGKWLAAAASSLPSLSKLNLSHSRGLTGEAVEQIMVSAKSLSSLDVSHCWRLNYSKVQKECAALPNLTVRTGKDYTAVPVRAPAAPPMVVDVQLGAADV